MVDGPFAPGWMDRILERARVQLALMPESHKLLRKKNSG